MSETWPDRPFRCPTCDSAFPELVAAGGCDDHWHEPEPRTVSQWRSEVERWAGILEQFSYAKNPVDAASRLAADMRRELAAQPPAPADEGKAKSGELDPALVERCAGAAYELEQLLGGTPWESVIRRNWAYQQDIYDRWIGIARAVLAAAQPPAPADEGFGEEYWRGHSVGRCEERERLEPSEDDNAALTDLIRNGLLGDDGLGAQHQRTDDGLPRDLARWIIDAGWRKPGAADTAEVLAGLREEMTAVCADVVKAMQFGLSGIDPYCGRPDDEERWMKRLAEWADWIHGEYVKPIEAAQQRLADRGRQRVDGECQHGQWAETCRLCAGIRERRRAPAPGARDEENTDG